MNIHEEISKVAELTGVSADKIKLANDGFCSRGYVINDGEIVFKFKKMPNTSYEPEIRMLNFVNSLGLKINLQKVGWTSPDDEYLGVYGVIGKSLEELKYDAKTVGAQLAQFLHKLHSATLENAEKLTLNAEIDAWQNRFYDTFAWEAISEYFTKDEMDKLDQYMHYEMPKKLKSLGEKLILSHGDLGDGNILIDNAGKVGVIDFNETCYLDEAADFMDVDSNELCEEILKNYGASDELHKKVTIRRRLRPLIVFGNYAKRGDKQKIIRLRNQIRKNFLSENEI